MIFYLQIRTTDKETIISLLSEGSDIVSESSIPLNKQSESLLEEMDLLLQKNNVTKEAVTKVVVETKGPSLTGLRIAVTTANLLALALDVPVISGNESVGVQEGYVRFVLPNYEKPPHITYPKR
ncbi:MAG TPA: hypothetical protein PK263_03895 [bacterium]|nr:hypothetical protein [bacterium]